MLWCTQYDTSNELRTRLQLSSNACIRYIFAVRRDVHKSPYRRQLGWLPSDWRRLSIKAILLFKITRLHEPEYLSAFFKKHKPSPSTRGIPPVLEVPEVKAKIGTKDFQIQGARFWNSLSPELRDSPSHAIFNQAVPKHLFDLEA